MASLMDLCQKSTGERSNGRPREYQQGWTTENAKHQQHSCPKISQQQKTMPAPLFGQRGKVFNKDNKTFDIRHGCPLFKCQPLTWDIGSLVAALAGAGTLCSALGGQVWRLCFWRVPAADFLHLVLFKRGHWIHRQQGLPGEE